MCKTVIFQVDSFTNTAYKGNPAAVCLVKKNIDKSQCQNIAAEMNLSETAFISPIGKNQYSIRYFTPTTEVPLCGHATLAASKVLYDKGFVQKNETIKFEAAEHSLSVNQNNDLIQMDFPSVEIEQCDVPKQFVELTQTAPLRVFKNNEGLLIAELINEQSVLKAAPKFESMIQEGIPALLITSAAYNQEYDFVSRCFAPGFGINEDPVTGNAHRTLAQLWSKRLGKTSLTGKQLSKRTGIVYTELLEDKIRISGNAIIIMEGEIILPQIELIEDKAETLKL